MIGDPPNIIIASRSGLTFNDFLLNMAPIAALSVAVLVAMLPLLFRGAFNGDPDRVADVMALNEREAITDRRLLIICGIVLAAVFVGFIGHAAFHIEPSVVALLGAGILVLLSRSEPRDFSQRGMGNPAVLRRPVRHDRRPGQDRRHRPACRGRRTRHRWRSSLTATMLILFVSALLSGVVDNIPGAAMSPIVLELTEGIADPVQSDALWWSPRSLISAAT